MFVLPILGTLQIDELETTHISMVLNKQLKTLTASGVNSIPSVMRSRVRLE
jgi:hypothetical protein